METDKTMNDALDLGTWLGRKQAFALISGRCSAADAECLRRLRNEKHYLMLGMNWDDFCTKKLGMSRPTADRVIRNLEEFGPKYFELAAVLRIPADQYRQIAAAVTDGGVVCDGETIEISPGNAPRLAQAVETLRGATQESPEPSRDVELLRTVSRARKSFCDAVQAYTRALELASPACDRATILRELQNAREMLALKTRA
jgi:hypothetical protein